MSPTQLRLWMRKNGNLGVFAVGCLVVARYLWMRRRPYVVSTIAICVMLGLGACP